MAGKKSSGLGSGLEAILGPSFGVEDLASDLLEAGADDEAKEIRLDKILANPYQPRKVFNEEELESLADSIREHGVFQPIMVRPTDTGYVLLAGERRVRAARMAGLETIPAIVRDFTDEQMMELSLLENIQREDLSAVEEAQSYQQLIENLGYTQEQLAKRLGKSRTHVTNILRLLNLPKEILDMVNNKELTMGQVRPLVVLEDKEEQIRLANMIKNMDLSARQAEMLAKKALKPAEKKEKPQPDPDVVAVQKHMQRTLGTKVRINPKDITISYNGTEDLNRILEILGLLEE